MIGKTSSNIYVSVSGPRDSGREAGYRKPQHTWMISIEPHHSHVPGLHHKDSEPIHYAASRNEETGLYTINTHEASAEPGIIGNILIVESAGIAPEKVHQLLEEELGPNSPVASPAASKRESSDDEPEHWIRSAIHGLQKRSIAQSFEIDEFMTFAHGYMANRMENEAPALIAYPRIHKDHEKKSSKHKFWISTPMADRTKTNKDGEAMKYGGLM